MIEKSAFTDILTDIYLNYKEYQLISLILVCIGYISSCRLTEFSTLMRFKQYLTDINQSLPIHNCLIWFV